MVILTMIFVVSGLASVSSPLEEAIACYDDLDYPCAESKLVQALENGLSDADRLRALYYQALIAAAWRDAVRMERLVRNIYATKADFTPRDAPPNLERVFNKLRPTPAVAPAWRGRLDYRHVLMVDHENDAAWWTDGDGVGAGISVRLRGRYVLEFALNWNTHAPKPERFSVEELQMLGLGGGGGLAYHLGRVWLSTGLLVGATRVDRTVERAYRALKDSSSQSSFWASSTALYLDVSVELVYGLSLGVRWSPTALIRVYEDQPTISYVLPLMIGLRYER